MNKALGLIETVGYTPAMAAVDVAVKTANVTFLGFDSLIGVAKKITLTVKFQGDVAAVKAAVEAGVAAASSVGEVFASHVIPHPHDEVDKIIFSKDTLASLQRKVNDVVEVVSEGGRKIKKNNTPEQQG